MRKYKVEMRVHIKKLYLIFKIVLVLNLTALNTKL